MSDGARRFNYNGAGRLTSATRAGVTTSYMYNALGQRIQKANATGSTLFAYDEQGHLIGEYDQNGLVQELVWLDDIPVATLRTDQGGTNTGLFYIHTDHLNAPTKITRTTNNEVIWRWDHDAYGNGIPNEDPDGNGLMLSMNLRFPGQYVDSETGLYYNYFRYYDPGTGRYITSDPIGLEGGLNTYAYVGGNPISNSDPEGLQARPPARISTRVQEHNRWNDPNRQLQRDYSYSYPEIPIYKEPEPVCKTVCPDPMMCRRPEDEPFGLPDPLNPGCVLVCSTGPFMKPLPPVSQTPNTTPAQRPASTGDWRRLLRMLRGG